MAWSIDDMRYVECLCHSDVWFVDYNGVPTQPDMDYPAKLFLNAYSSYWCVACDAWFRTWGDAVEHLFPDHISGCTHQLTDDGTCYHCQAQMKDSS